MNKMQKLLETENMIRNANQKFRACKQQTAPAKQHKQLLLDAIDCYRACRRLGVSPLDEFKISFNTAMCYKMLLIKQNDFEGPSSFGSLVQAIVVDKNEACEFYRQSLRSFAEALDSARRLGLQNKADKITANTDQLVEAVEDQFRINSNKHTLLELVRDGSGHYEHFSLESQTRILRMETEYHCARLEHAQQTADFSPLAPLAARMLESPHHANPVRLESETEFSKLYSEFSRLVDIYSTVSAFVSALAVLGDGEKGGGGTAETELLSAHEQMLKVCKSQHSELRIVRAQANFRVAMVYLQHFDDEKRAKESLQNCFKLASACEHISQNTWLEEAEDWYQLICDGEKELDVGEDSEFEVLRTAEEESLFRNLQNLRLDAEVKPRKDWSS